MLDGPCTSLGKRLCHNIHDLVVSRNIIDVNLLLLILLTEKMILDIDMLGPFVEFRVFFTRRIAL